MKKWYFALLSIVMYCVFASCGDSNNSGLEEDGDFHSDSNLKVEYQGRTFHILDDVFSTYRCGTAKWGDLDRQIYGQFTVRLQEDGVETTKQQYICFDVSEKKLTSGFKFNASNIYCVFPVRLMDMVFELEKGSITVLKYSSDVCTFSFSNCVFVSMGDNVEIKVNGSVSAEVESW